MSTQPDDRLVSLARAGHERAFAAIVERYRPELHALARRLNSDGRAEDIVQQTFLSAFAALRSGTHVGHLRGWLYQIARNAAIKARAPIDVSLEGVAVCSAPLEDVVQDRATAARTLSELRGLPHRQREALVGTALHGYARADVAKSMGLSEGAVRQLVHRARTSLRTAVGALTPYPLARWFAAPPGPAIMPDVPIAAAATSAAGVAVKVGALIASGVAAIGIPALQTPAPRHPHRAAPGIAVPRQLRSESVSSSVAVALVRPRLSSSSIGPARRAARQLDGEGTRRFTGAGGVRRRTAGSGRGEPTATAPVSGIGPTSSGPGASGAANGGGPGADSGGHGDGSQSPGTLGSGEKGGGGDNGSGDGDHQVVEAPPTPDVAPPPTKRSSSDGGSGAPGGDSSSNAGSGSSSPGATGEGSGGSSGSSSGGSGSGSGDAPTSSASQGAAPAGAAGDGSPAGEPRPSR